jgi:LCP family protein required for cell wall assembly
VIFRRALTLLGLTLVAPGSAQLVGGTGAGPIRARFGRLALRIWAAFLLGLVLLALVALIHRELVLGLFTHQLVLRGLAGLFLAAGVGWPLLTFDAWNLAGVRRLPVRSRRRVALLAVLVIVLTGVVPIAAGRRVWAAADLLHGVFGSKTRSAAEAGRYNVLLLGGDAGPTRIGTRPDSMTLASIDAKTGRTALISLPRNLQNVPFLPGTPAAKAMPNGWSCGDTCLLNAIYTWGGEHAQYFPGVKDPGAEAMKQSIQAITGLKVNYYVLIDLQGFRSMIDAVGGIDIDVVARTPIGGETSKVTRWIEPGKQHLNGFHALWYARSRSASSDYDRMARQRCVMTAMVNQLDPTTLLRHFQQIAAAGPKVVSTDIPAAALPEFLTLGEQAKNRKIESLQFVPPLIVPKDPDYTLIRTRVAGLIADSERGGNTTAAAPPAASPTAKSGVSASPSPSASSKSSLKTTRAGVTPTPTIAGTPYPTAPGVDVQQVCQAA